ncbi:electron transport complex subunit RsxA [Sedimentibacter sp. zth1]|uniref:electron transport complex subunit RsxA n=1 Tax=Sedimentibacter sp. zth1 TaxID=2816908 RepID=UPI001A935D86|nr:electron transport complex subunit RsxA [Sedimentibacter sp. zth1]QSX06206.1 electron transport complex subunit RsxA [Sedimentibacter sp. zth1]
MNLFSLFIGALLVNNIIFAKFMGICPFLGVSKKINTAIGMGVAVTFVITLSSIITWLLQNFVLNKLGLGYLQTIAFILVIAALVQFVEMFLKKSSPSLYEALGVYLPLITTNCAVLGVALLNIKDNYNLVETIVNSLGSSLSFLLAIVLFAGIRERLALADIPESLQGFPIALITAGLMSIAFLGFSGLAI